MSRKYFIAGTDTGIGKTWVTSTLLSMCAASGKRVLGLKPVAAGADVEYNGRIENEDAVALHSVSNVDIDFRDLNPFCLPDPLSPHIAADFADVKLTVKDIHDSLYSGLEAQSDLCLIEGAGGWRVPINDSESMADLACALSVPVILIVGMRLGCLSHALLTAEAIERDGLRLHGWVANELSPDMPALEENILTLVRRINAPLLGRVRFGQKFVAGAESPNLDIRALCE